MFSQSFNYLPNKKQSLFANQSPQNMGLLRGLTSKTCQDSSEHLNLEIMDPRITNHSKSFGPSRTNIGILDLVYSFTETSRLDFGRRLMPTFSVPSDKSKLNCKEIIGLTNCNAMTSPLARSYLVGGFVGSKSQLGRKRKNNAGQLNLWDMICDLVNLVGRTSPNYPQRPNCNLPSNLDKKSDIMIESNIPKETSDKNNRCGLEKPSSFMKQSYADVTKRSTKHNPLETISESQNQLIVSSDKRCDKTTISVMEQTLLCNKSDKKIRDRITSECSADSEDSFIVFECSEEDNLDKDIFSSDDDTLSNTDEVSQSDSGIVPSSNTSFSSKQSSKKVHFAKDKSLVKIHPMVTWDYAYRMARKGPWEMLARDSERFKLRIARTEAVLKPIMDPQHRSVVYQERFSGLVR